jgi:hypothetical protein
MKKSALIILASAITSAVASHSVYANQDQWAAQSTETQHGLTSNLLIKRSDVSTTAVASAMDKGAVAGNNAQQKSKYLHQQAARSTQQRTVVSHANQDFWIYDASVTLRNDLDYDGYAYRFSLEFDADTVYQRAEVYARLYLTRGELYKEFHTTSVFSIFGDDEGDSLVVDTELLNGFPTGDYEMLIELYDAYSDELVATLDSYDDPDLYLLSLESKNFEYTETTVIVEGGSAGWLSLLLLPVLWLRNRAKLVA